MGVAFILYLVKFGTGILAGVFALKLAAIGAGMTAERLRNR